MKTYKIVLTQHTPLIHFQREQVGAGLRASEVKPRFDKFMIDQEPNFDAWKELLTGYLHVSDDELKTKSEIEKACAQRIAELKSKFKEGTTGLDYKLRIYPPKNYDKETEFKEKGETLPMFFAKDKAAILRTTDIVVEFASWNEKMIELIKKNFETFIAKNNFGTRQTKGYGCFFIKDKEYPVEAADFSFVISEKDYNIMFEKLAHFHAVIRSGINNKGLYIKSALYKYLAASGIQWDKKTVKQRFYTTTEKEEQHGKYENEPLVNFVNNTGDVRMYKELLGLSTDETWMRVSDTMTTTHKLKREHVGGTIKRFKSPILFKPIKTQDGNGYIVYIVLSEIPEEMKNTKFKYTWDTQYATWLTAKDFSLKTYFDWIYDNKQNIIDGCNCSQRNAEARANDIRKCFSSMKKLS